MAEITQKTRLEDGRGAGLGKSLARTTEMLSVIVMGLANLLFWAVNQILLLLLRFIRILGMTVKLVMTFLPNMISHFVPNKTSSWLNQQLIYSGVEMTSEEVLSITLVYSVVVAAIAFLISVIVNAPAFVASIAVLIAFGSVWCLPYVLLNMLSTSRCNAVEGTLPDVLGMIAQNMAAGMTSYNALWSAARPEFGPLAVEIQDVAKATLTGIPLTDALMGMTNHVKSAKLPRVVRLIIQGMKSGGELPHVLQAIATDMRREGNLKSQMAAETSAQTIFILFAIMVGAPLLFSVSSQFINIFSTMMAKLDVQELSKNAPQAMITISPISISSDFFQIYALGILLISSVFGSLLIGILKTGNPISGVPSIPLFTAVSIAMFLTLKYLLGMFFSGLVSF